MGKLVLLLADGTTLDVFLNKERITIRLDPEVIEWFREQVKGGGNYQTLINDALLGHIQRQSSADLESTLRRVLREELRQAS